MFFVGVECDCVLLIFGLVMGIGGVVGLLVGGVFISVDIVGLGWCLVFLINVLVGLIVVLFGWCWILYLSVNVVKVYFDIVGVVWMVVSVVVVLVLLLFGCELYWLVWILVLFVVGVLGMVMF